MARRTARSIAGHDIEFTNLGKVLYPETGTTKADVLEYYLAVAPLLLEGTSWRPATLRRWVNGVGTAADPGRGFFQKTIGADAPPWVKHFSIEHSDHTNEYPLVNDAATLAWLAQLAALEIHTPQWRFGPRGGRRRPDRLVVDLDPGEGVPLSQCADVAVIVRAWLLDRGLESTPVTSGSKGIHVYATLDGSLTSDAASALAHELAREIEADHRDLVVSDMSKRRRLGKVFIDWSQNNGAKTTVAPYSLRGSSRPTVAAPRTWTELAAPTLRHLEYTEVLSRIFDARPGPGHEMPMRPMLAASLQDGALDGDAWRFEMKWDGIRAVCEVQSGVPFLWSRNGKTITAAFPELAAELPDAVGGRDAVVDGEIVALDAHGRPSFERLQDRLGAVGAEAASRATRTPVHLMLFDVLAVDGQSTTERPYLQRRTLLESLVVDGPHVHVPPSYETELGVAMSISRKNGLEGVVAKRSESRYLCGRRSDSWRKVKHEHVAEVVLVGWAHGVTGGLGSLVVAVPTEKGGLRYAGRVGSGFTKAERIALEDALLPLARRTAPLTDVPAQSAGTVTWVTPALVGEVRYGEWTQAGRMRHPSWRGLRRDKTPAEVQPPGRT